MIALKAIGGDQIVDRFANSNPFLPQSAIVSSTLDGKIGANQADLQKFSQGAARFLKIGILAKALDHFCQDQIAHKDGGVFKNAVQVIGLRGFSAVEIVDPDRGVNQQHG